MKRHLGKARYPVILVLLIAAVAIFLRIQLVENGKAKAAMILSVPTSAELALALHRVGLDPEALTAAGVSPSAVDTVVGDAVEHLMVNLPLIEVADDAWAQSRQQCDQLKRVIQSGRATQEQIDAYPGARSQLALTKAQRQSALDDLFSAATDALSGSLCNTLATICGNRNWVLPIEFLVIDRPEPEWVQLRDCLANERIADNFAEDPDPDAQASLAQIRANPLVAAAKANLDANLAVVESAWEQAVSQ
jgi:hypothetical protein